MSEPKELLGYWVCPQGGKAEVRQTKKRGRHFYTRCDCCGLMQGTGATFQQKIFDEAEFIAGLTVVTPSNVSEGKAPVSEIPEPKTVERLTADFDPTEQTEETKETEVTEKTSGISGGKLAAGLVLLAAAGVGAWMN